MKKLLLVLFFTAMGMFKGQSQALVQTYIDRCTGQMSVFSVPLNGSTVVAFYNRSRSFTSQDFQNGTLQSWLEETYLWWTSLSPCSTTTTGATATQQTTQQTTQQATQAATNAAASTANVNTTANVPSAPTGPTPTTQTPQTTTPDTSTTSVNPSPSTPSTSGADTSGTGNNTTSTGGSTSGETTTQTEATPTETSSTETTQSTEETSTTNSTESDNQTQTEDSTETSNSSENEGSTTEAESTEGDSGDGETTTESTESEDVEETTTEETTEESTEESSESETEETTEESTEEESTEETTEEESETEETDEETTEEESDESTEEESEEEDTEEESESDEDEETEEEESEEESSNEDEEEEEEDNKKKRNLAPPIVTANAMSQQLPTGEFQQAVTFGVSQSSLMGDKTYGLNAMVYDNLQQFMLTANYSKVHINDKGRVSRVYSASVGGMKMFTTYMAMMNHSMTFLGEKGSVAGIAFGSSLTTNEIDVVDGIIKFDNQFLGLSLTGFYTRSITVSPKLSVSPMLALSSPFMMFDMYRHDTMWSKDLMIIGGSSFSYKLTQRFGLNLGVNVIESTTENFPTMMAFTIGSRLSF